jgi:hypothetical protein
MTWKDISGSPRIEYTKWLEARANGTSSFQFENNKRRPAQLVPTKLNIQMEKKVLNILMEPSGLLNITTL